MELKKLITRINDALNEAACERESVDEHYVFCCIDTEDGSIDVEEERKPIKGEAPVRVYVNHDKDGKCECVNLEAFLEAHVGADWDAADETVLENNQPYDVWNEHGFADEADYLRWRYG